MGVLMKVVWRSPGAGMGVLRWRCVCVLGCGRAGEIVLDKWHSLYANTHYSMSIVCV